MSTVAKLPSREQVKRRSYGVGTRENGRDPLVITGIRRGELREFGTHELEQLLIDETYQRGEKRQLVNQMILTLQAGGIIPDAIAVVVRQDGQHFIVDGQQRWWAHWVAQKPLHAQLYHILPGFEPIEVEKAMFTAFNNYVRPSPSIRAKSWPGASSKLLHYLNDSEDSPIRTEVGFGNGGAKYAASSLLPGMLAAIGGTGGRGYRRSTKVENVLAALDLVIRNCRDYGDLKHRAILYTVILRNIFAERDHVHWIAARALGHVCGEKWQKERAYTPTEQEMRRLAIINWEHHAPHRREEIIPILQAEILRRWKS